MNEDRLGETLRRWGADVAPDVAVDTSGVVAAAGRRRTRMRTAGVAAVLLVGVASASVATVLGERPDRLAADPAALECPAEVPVPDQLWVPALPTFPEAGTALAPGDAVDGVVCAFAPRAAMPLEPSGRAGTLADHRRLDRPAAREVAAFLHELPFDRQTVCPAMASSGVAALVGLRSGDGTVTWVRTGEHCVDATNGSFATAASLGVVVEGLLDTGTLVLPPSATDPCQPGTGRRGQSHEVVPDGASGLTVCFRTSVIEVDDPAVLEPLVRELRGLELVEDTDSCSPADGDTSQVGAPWTLRFHYPTGPDAWVEVVPGCDPEVRVPGRQAVATPELNTLLTALVE